MKSTVYIAILAVLSITLAGCSSKARLKSILTGIFPSNTQVTLTETCVKILGPAVVLFSVASLPSEESILKHTPDGIWTRSISLSEFAKADTKEYKGAGVSATILDGKDCLRDKTDKAEDILFGNMDGLYFRSKNRQVVAILFDDPQGSGVMFLQAP